MSLVLFKSLNPWSRLIIFIIMMMVSAFIVGVLAILAIVGFYDLNLQDFENIGENIESDLVGPMLWLNSIILQIGAFIVPAIVFAWFFGKDSINNYWLRTPGWKIILVPIIMIFALPLIDLLVHFNDWIIPEGSWIEAKFKPIEEKAEEFTKALLVMPNWGTYARNVFLVAILPAIGEELAFRGVLQSQLAKISKNIHLAIWIAAAIFSFIHMQFYGFFARMFLGAIMGYLLIWTGSIWAAILAHFTNNFTAVTIDFYAQRNNIVPDELSDGMVNSYSILATCFFAVLVLVMYFIKNNEWTWIKATYLHEPSEHISSNTEVLDG